MTRPTRPAAEGDPAADPAPAHAFALRLDDDLALRLRERHHAHDLYARVDRERAHLARALPWAPGFTLEHAERGVAAGLEQFRRGRGWQADLCRRGTPIGSMGLHFLDGPGGSTEVGYWIDEAWEGRGLLTRAMHGLHRHFFEGRGLGRVSIGVAPGNPRSVAVARRLGYEPEAVLRGAHLGPHGAADLAFFGLLREAWAGPGEGAGGLPLPRFALRVDDELELGLLERGDAPELHALVVAERDRLAPWLPWALAPSAAGTLAFVEGRALPAIAAAEGFEAGVWWRGRLVGAVGLHGVHPRPLRGSIGYWLAGSAVGQGVMTRVVRAVVAKAFGDLGFERVDVRADVANVRSRAVPERLGFVHEGVLRRALHDGRGYVDLAVYGLLRSEWSP